MKLRFLQILPHPFLCPHTPCISYNIKPQHFLSQAWRLCSFSRIIGRSSFIKTSLPHLCGQFHTDTGILHYTDTYLPKLYRHQTNYTIQTQTLIQLYRRTLGIYYTMQIHYTIQKRQLLDYTDRYKTYTTQYRHRRTKLYRHITLYIYQTNYTVLTHTYNAQKLGEGLEEIIFHFDMSQQPYT